MTCTLLLTPRRQQFWSPWIYRRHLIRSVILFYVNACSIPLASPVQRGAGKRAHVSALLRDRLHWLRVPQRIEYKLCLLVYKALHGMAPVYLSELCHPVRENVALTGHRSAARGDLQVPGTNTNFGRHAFAFAGPHTWNLLPAEIRATDNLQTFKSQLKTHLFLQNC